MSHQEEAQGTAQDTLEGLCLLDGLETPWAPHRGAGGGVWGERSLGVSTESADPATRSRIKQKTMSTSTSCLHRSALGCSFPSLKLVCNPRERHGPNKKIVF
ncbi:hypothetical protein GOODEAATRI_028306 [Goodea atripinnis]|uniref:Uncharacterized protein n=1 Tax=Goodea atripinnis TaxID=208336 RepID=A0ABV0P8H9_9TELE